MIMMISVIPQIRSQLYKTQIIFYFSAYLT